jgi:hypothetical protein
MYLGDDLAATPRYLGPALSKIKGAQVFIGAPPFKKHRRRGGGSRLLGALMPADLFTSRTYGEQGLPRESFLGAMMPADLFTSRVYGEEGLPREQLGHFDLIDKFLPEEMQGRGVAGDDGLLGQAGPAQGTQLVNPYPNGIMVAGTGPNNSATNWAVAFHKEWGVWAANTGFGAAPVFTDGQIPNFLNLSHAFNWQGSGIVSYSLLGTNGKERFLRRLDGSGESADGIPGLLHYLVILDDPLNVDGGQQRVTYRMDPSTGYWIPASAQGLSAKGGNFWNTLIIAGVIIVASVVTYGAATGWFAGAGGLLSGITAGQAVGFVGSAAGAANSIIKLTGGGGSSGSTSAPGPVAVAPPASVAGPAAVPGQSGSVPATPGVMPVTYGGGGSSYVPPAGGGGGGYSFDPASGQMVPDTGAAPVAAGVGPSAGFLSQLPPWAWIAGALGLAFVLT